MQQIVSPTGQPLLQSGIAPTQVIIVQGGSAAPQLDQRALRRLRPVAILLIICGMLSGIFNSIAINIDASAAFIGYGIWSGVMCIIAGSFGVRAAYKQSRCLIVTTMVLAILSGFLSGIQVFFVAPGLMDHVYSRRYMYRHYYIPEEMQTDEAYRKHTTAIAILSILVLLMVLEVVLSCVASALACSAYCDCCRSRSAAGQVVLPSGQGGPVQVIYTASPGHQQGFIYRQPGIEMQPVQQPVGQYAGVTYASGGSAGASSAHAPPEYTQPTAPPAYSEKMRLPE